MKENPPIYEPFFYITSTKLHVNFKYILKDMCQVFWFFFYVLSYFVKKENLYIFRMILWIN